MTTAETIARIIDPSRWAVMDSYLAETKRKLAGKDAGYDPDNFKDKASLTKAAAILEVVGYPCSPLCEGYLREQSLLAALTDLLEACGGDQNGDREWAWQERQNARAAIAKATGQ